jgi:phosphatidylglycerophosphatase A
MREQGTGQNLDPSAGAGRSVAQHAMLFVGSLAYLGFVPIASGTVAVAVVGVPLYLLLVPYMGLSWWAYSAFIVAFTLVAIWVAGHTDRILNEKDSHKNVIDEIPGYLIALVALPVTWQIITVAFFLERAIDIAKIWPASWIERHLPRGWGVVLDDVVAGIYALALLHLGTYLLPGWFGVRP